MNRRRFLQILAGTAAASTTAYFLPPIGGWKSDVIAKPTRRWFYYLTPEGEAKLGEVLPTRNGYHVVQVGPHHFESYVGNPPQEAFEYMRSVEALSRMHDAELLLIAKAPNL